MGNPYRHPISTPVPELQGIATIASPPMTDDLVGRLRKRADQHGILLSDPPRPTADNALLSEAAARIEALEAALTEVRKYVGYAFDGTLYAPQTLDAIDDVAKAALTPGAPHAD